MIDEYDLIFALNANINIYNSNKLIKNNEKNSSINSKNLFSFYNK